MEQLHEPVEVHLVSDIKKREVLVDTLAEEVYNIN
jgi:hypothetical protein